MDAPALIARAHLEVAVDHLAGILHHVLLGDGRGGIESVAGTLPHIVEFNAVAIGERNSLFDAQACLCGGERHGSE